MKMSKVSTLPTFNDVENPTIKAWNRSTVFVNTCKDLGKAFGKQYVEQFTGGDKASMLVILTLIKTKGYEETRREVNRGEL